MNCPKTIGECDMLSGYGWRMFYMKMAMIAVMGLTGVAIMFLSFAFEGVIEGLLLVVVGGTICIYSFVFLLLDMYMDRVAAKEANDEVWAREKSERGR